MNHSIKDRRKSILTPEFPQKYVIILSFKNARREKKSYKFWDMDFKTTKVIFEITELVIIKFTKLNKSLSPMFAFIWDYIQM